MPRWLEHRIPPPVIDAAFVLLMWLIARALPQAQLWPRGASVLVLGAALGVALALAGGVIALAGVVEFRRARTTVNPLAPQKASTLVTTGVFGITRNPMYLGMWLVLAGWGVWLGNAAAWVALPLFVLTINALQIQPEERALRERFGEAFTRYAARVRRWV
ncbi:MAG: isoprenylcysteine carboxylmethyltransferase family protein [Pseudomonadota bacterium]|nr:isoprenylcysteine carboxylmethyltransferase family protein [Pseudomonadota bacterium]